MEEGQETQGETTHMDQPANPQSPEVGFPLPSSQPSPKGGNKLPLIILGIVIILAAGGIFFLTRGSRESTNPSATIEGESTYPTETPIPTATPAPVDKTKVKIQIQNGTGISGEAAYLQGILRGLGYTNITVANATSKDPTTTVTFSPSLDSSVVDEITAKLQSIYQEVNSKTSSSISTDVLIVAGLRKGQTMPPSPTAAPSASPSESPTPTPSAT